MIEVLLCSAPTGFPHFYERVGDDGNHVAAVAEEYLLSVAGLGND